MSIIKYVALQKIVAHDFRYDPRTFIRRVFRPGVNTAFFTVQQFYTFVSLLFVYSELV